MKTFILSITLLTSATAPAFAHSDHAHGKKKATVQTDPTSMAQAAIKDQIEQKKLDPSWAKAKLLSKSQKAPSSPEWALEYENPEPKDASKRKLYVYVGADRSVRMSHSEK